MSHDHMNHEGAKKLYDLIKETKVAMMTSVEADGSLHSRPMHNHKADEAGDLWFFTDKTESVARNVSGNPQVGLGFSDPHGDDYVAVSGTGTLVEDRATIDDKWNEILKAWFPGGKDDSKLVLLKVSPARGEYWDSKSSLLTNVVGFVKSKLGGGPADDLVDQAKVTL